MKMGKVIICDLQKIPGVGKNIEEDLLNIGIRTIEDLKGKDLEELYQMDCIYKGFQEDRCQLYVFRSAVYFAEHNNGSSIEIEFANGDKKKFGMVLSAVNNIIVSQTDDYAEQMQKYRETLKKEAAIKNAVSYAEKNFAEYAEYIEYID